MVKRSLNAAGAFLGLTLLAGLSGCSGGVARTDSVQVTAQDMAKSKVSRAGMFLDNIEKLPPNQRQAAASVPAAAQALSDAYQSDPATKQRIDALGLKVAPPVPRGPKHATE